MGIIDFKVEGKELLFHVYAGSNNNLNPASIVEAICKYIKEIECIDRTFQQRKLKGHMVSLCNSTKTLGNN